MGISMPSLFALMHGDQLPSDETLGKICKGLGLSKPEQDELVKLATLERAKSVTRVFLREVYAHVSEKRAAPRPKAKEGVPLFNLEVAPESASDGGLFLGTPEGGLSVPGLEDTHAMACILHGNSMEPLFADGDILIFSSAQEPASGDICLAVARDITIVARLFVEGETMRLVPSNPRCRERIIPRSDVEQLWRLCGAFTWYPTGRFPLQVT